MTWRDRLYSTLPYLLPMSAIMPLGDFLLKHLGLASYIFFPFIWLYRNVLMFQVIPQLGITGELIIFICLYALVIRNYRCDRFIRFNTMQALLLEVIIFAGQLIIQVLAQSIYTLSSALFLVQVLANTLFLGITVACIYAIYTTVKGQYSEIPTISEAAFIQSE